MQIESSKPGEELLKITPSFAKKAARACLSRYLREEKEELSTRDFTAVVLPYCETVVVSWAYTNKRGKDVEKSLEFSITAI